MSITFECENCGKKIKAQDHLIGKKVRCPNCKEIVLATEVDNNISAVASVSEMTPSQQTVPCPACGEQILSAAQKCKHCMEYLGETAQKNEMPIQVNIQTNVHNHGQRQRRNVGSPGVAAVLSFFITGLGQFYNGEILKGIIYLLSVPVNIILCFFLIGLITWPLTWLICIVDAYYSANKKNNPTRVGSFERRPSNARVSFKSRR